MSAEKSDAGITTGKKKCEVPVAKEGIETEELTEEECDFEDDYDDEDEEEDEDEDEIEYDPDIETEIEHQTPEVIAKELLITYLESNALPYPDTRRSENRYQAIGRAIGEMYNALLEEIRKTSE